MAVAKGNHIIIILALCKTSH